jgi:Tol biopolymer transport system component
VKDFLRSAALAFTVLFTALNAGPARAASPATAVAGAGEKKPALEPLFVRPLVGIGTGRNDSRPTWSPRGSLVAFERSIGEKKEIHLVRSDGTPVKTVYLVLSGDAGEMKFFFPGVSEDISYNAGLTWSPGEDRFAFMSNGGEGAYDLYLQDLAGGAATRLTDDGEKDGQAEWSPVADRIVFVSGRTGTGDVYLLDLSTRALARLTRGDRPYFYPTWSPDGSRIALMCGNNENHDIAVINDPARPAESLKALTTWTRDDLRPAWSPDGKKIAFYTNDNPDGDPKRWSLAVIASDGSDPAEGAGLSAKIVASDVVPDVEAGPAWMPDGNRIVFVKNEQREYNPLYVADLARRTVVPLKTGTKMNHDVACSTDGTIAFRAQEDQWDQIYVMKLKN